MKALICILFLLALDLASKHIFRFYEGSLDLPFIFVEGYLYIEKIVFNYGTVYSEADGPEDASSWGDALFYISCGIGILGASATIAVRDEDESFWYSIPGIVLISGGLGNSIDKIYYEGVCDWLTITRPETDWIYVMNLADIFLALGLFGLIFITTESWKWRSLWFVVWLLWFVLVLGIHILFFDPLQKTFFNT